MLVVVFVRVNLVFAVVSVNFSLSCPDHFLLFAIPNRLWSQFRSVLYGIRL
ncbi:hypothetical protein NDI45_20305 [Leptolyngbya sp. GB1-A1]|uniref:hypothetical protein n=1 Tax=Leptolyngbya sp. GB1-A1 TaxID=2933908 RepID=UPI00329960AF